MTRSTSIRYIFNNFDLECIEKDDDYSSLYISRKYPLSISLAIDACTIACTSLIEEYGTWHYGPRLTNTEYVALSNRIHELAQAEFDNYGPLEEWINSSYDAQSIEQTFDLGMQAIGRLPAPKLVSAAQIYAMCALWAFDNAFSLVIAKGWVDEAVEMVVNATENSQTAITIHGEERALLRGSELQEVNAAIQLHQRKLAQRAATARHAANSRLRQEALRLYFENPKKWRSKRQAAIGITPIVQAFASNNSIQLLSTDRAQQTIYEWICSAVKLIAKN